MTLEVRAPIEEVRGIAVPKRVRRDPRTQARALDGAFHDPTDRPREDRAVHVHAREDVLLRAADAPVRAERVEKGGRERDDAVLATLPLADGDHHALRVDGRHLEMRDLGGTHATRVDRHDDGAVPDVAGVLDEAENLVPLADHDRDRAGRLGIRDALHDPVLERDAVEEPESGCAVPDDVMPATGVEEVNLVLANVLEREPVRPTPRSAAARPPRRDSRTP